MQGRRIARRRSSVSAVAGIALAAIAVVPVGAQSGSKAKVLTPPKARDTTTAQRTPAATATPAPAAPAAAAPPAVVPQSPVLDSIREVVFHNLLDKDRAGFSTLASAFCLSLSTDDFKKASTSQNRADPSEGMVRRLSTPRTPARRASTCTFTPNAQGRSVAGRALLYSVGAIDLSAGDRAEAAAGYNYDGYSSGGYTFSVERSDSGWVVKQWRMEWTAKSGNP
jgi:hypothetical protein